MAKIFETSPDIADMALSMFNETGMAQVGLNLKIMSVPKAKDIIKVGRASATAEFLAKKSDIITMTIFEEAFDRLPDEYKAKLLEGALSNISYDSEKDKIIVDNSRYGEFFRMRAKYANYGDILEGGMAVIDQIAEEEKARKEEEKERKKAAREAKKR